jgi:hypothetical protein
MTKPEDNIWHCDLEYLNQEARRIGKSPTPKQTEWFCGRSWQLVRDYCYPPEYARQQAFNELIR